MPIISGKWRSKFLSIKPGHDNLINSTRVALRLAGAIVIENRGGNNSEVGIKTNEALYLDYKRNCREDKAEASTLKGIKNLIPEIF